MCTVLKRKEKRIFVHEILIYSLCEETGFFFYSVGTDTDNEEDLLDK